MTFLFYITLLGLLGLSLSAKILLYNPLLAQSHVNFMSVITDVLVQGGHDVTVLAPRSNPIIRFDGSHLKKLIQFDLAKEILEGVAEAMDDPDYWVKQPDAVGEYFTQDLNPILVLSELQCAGTLNHSNLLEDLRNEKFDLGISEFFDCCGVGIFHQIGLENVVLTSSALMFEALADALGIPPPMTYIPGTMSSSTSGELADSLLLRLKNVVVTATSRNLFYSIQQGGQNALDKLFPENSPSLKDLAARSSFVFTNTEPLVDFPRPTLHKVVDIGGIAVPEPKPVDETWEKLLSLRSKTVLISFGSVGKAYQMPTDMKASIVEIVKRFPDITFIWKYEKEDDVGKNVGNLVKTKWMPQNDLLHTGKISLFVTHGGMGSVLETAASSTPFVAIGLYADQMRNARAFASHGSGVSYDKRQIANADLLEAAIRKVLEDQSYAKNAKRLSQMLNSRPFSPKELLTRHIRFVAENGPLHRLSPVSAKMSFVQLYFLDAIFVLASIIAIVVYASVRLFRKLLIGRKHKKVD